MSAVASQFDYPLAVARRFVHPRHAGSLKGGRNVFAGQAGSRQGGCSVRLWLEVLNDRVGQMRFEAYGCPYFIAAAEMLAEWCEGRATAELLQWPWQSVEEELVVPASRRGCLLVLRNALNTVVIAHRTTQAANG